MQFCVLFRHAVIRTKVYLNQSGISIQFENIFKNKSCPPEWYEVDLDDIKGILMKKKQLYS